MLNVPLLSKHEHDIVSDKRLINKDISYFTETQIKAHYSTSTIQSLFKFRGGRMYLIFRDQAQQTFVLMKTS